jgi:hypothetical protein
MRSDRHSRQPVLHRAVTRRTCLNPPLSLRRYHGQPGSYAPDGLSTTLAISRLLVINRTTDAKGVYEDSTHLLSLAKADSALLRSSLFHQLCRFFSFSSGGFSVGEGVPLRRPRIQVVHGTVPQECARNTLPARSGVLYRPAIAGLRCHPLLTSSTRAPEVTPN